MLRALDEFHVEGIPTTMPFHRWVLRADEFVHATASTRWVEEALAASPLGQPAAEAAPAHDGRPRPPVRVVVEVDGHRVPVSIWGDQLRAAPPAPASAAGGHALTAVGEVISAPMQGTILQVLVQEGQAVAAGDTVCILEAMKMENHITAHQDGVVTEVNVRDGDVVDLGEVLATVTETADDEAAEPTGAGSP
jgi:acetyl-CoA/propionyl-CoA carboxylase biotin carboxyl carrier protein